MKKIIIGVDPHKLSATIEAVDDHERMLASGRRLGGPSVPREKSPLRPSPCRRQATADTVIARSRNVETARPASLAEVY